MTTTIAIEKTPVPLVVVTGASEGIGLAIAERFARLGHDLLLVARGDAALAAVAEAIAARHDVMAIPLAVDLTSPEAADRIAAAASAAGGFVDVLVNNAGTGFCGAFDEAAPHELENLVHLNVRAVTMLTHRFLPGMRLRRRGGIINVASLAGYTPGPWQAAYYASKAYVVSLSEALATEVAGDNVRVTVVAPGPVETRFHAKMGAEASLYRRLLPMPGPRSVAWRAVAGYRWRLRVVVPDVWSLATFPFLRFLPHRLLVPIVGWLLKPRRREVENARGTGA
jgi:uncharacterized protein